jgi:hypothetical protein
MIGAFLHPAILATERIAQKDVLAAERDGPIRDPDIPPKSNHLRQSKLRAGRRNNTGGILNGMGNTAEKQFESATSRANVNCLVS